ncbi:MAG: hypothetical protein U0802_20115 [Candidatus Binatia bacterium]
MAGEARRDSGCGVRRHGIASHRHIAAARAVWRRTAKVFEEQIVVFGEHNCIDRRSNIIESNISSAGTINSQQT